MAKKKVLVVDDEPDMRVFVSTVVATMGLEALAAQNGEDALQKAGSDPPDLVILDIMMPKIEDGIQTYRRFRSDKTLSRIPVIILSAIAQKTFLHSIRILTPHQGGLLPEPDAYMEKPPDAGTLGKLIEEVLNRAS